MRLRIGILGAGHIAAKMARTLNFLRGEMEPYAIASRDLARAEALRAATGFSRAYGSYGEMLADPRVDVVYIATPNHLHREHSLACIAAGKHIVCEKPFALTEADAREVFNEAEKRGVFAMEALWTRFQPAARLIREAIASGEIGEVRFASAAFGLAISGKERIAKVEMGGGAMLDLGIYPLNFADMFMGIDEECRVSSVSTSLPGGADDQSAVAISWPDGRLASVLCSATAAMGAWGRISGTRGSIEIPALTRCESFRVRKITSDEVREVHCPFDCNGYEYEMRAAAAAIAGGRRETSEMPWSATLRMARLLESLANRPPQAR